MSEVKPVIRQMIDNNKPHWRPETIRGAHKQLDEYEAKSRAFDAGLEAVHDRLQHILHNTDTGKLLPGYVDGMYNALDIINECYESGESD